MTSSKEIKKVWRNNFTTNRRNSGTNLVDRPIFESVRMPSNLEIMGRFKYLLNTISSKVERIKVITDEIIQLWKQTLNFPYIKQKSVINKITRLVEKYKQNQKHQNKTENSIFDITDTNGIWLNREDRQFYELQLQSKGKIGFSSSIAPISTIHPSKRIKNTKIHNREY